MCRYDNGDGFVTELGMSSPIARVTHKCRECLRTINPGERYVVDRFVHDGRFTAHKVCQHCHAARGWLSDECGGWVYGEVADDILEHARDGYGWPVKRLAVGIANKWQAPSGRLLPVPAIPLTTMEVEKAKTS